MTEICSHATTCTPTQLSINPAVSHSTSLKRKELLFSYRDHFKCVYAVHSGAIKTFQVEMNGQERINHFYLPGELIGLEAFQLGHYPHSAIALTTSTVCEIPFDHLLEIVATNSALQKHLITTFSERISQSQYVTAPTAEQRLAAFVLDMSKRLKNLKSPCDIELPMSRYDIGNFLGLAPETISRLFTRFQQSNLLKVQNKKITLTDRESLQWVAQDGLSKHS